MANLTEEIFRNNFDFLGYTEKWLAEDVEYQRIYEFEKQDYVPIHWWISKNAVPIYSLSLLYLLAVWVLQRWMKTREAFDLRRHLFCWNVVLALLSMVMFSRILPETIHVNKNYGLYRSYCKRDHMNAASLFWFLVYASTKPLEFVDTFFMILRKQKLTFLHVFHHATIHVATVFAFVHVDPPSRYFGIMNTFVHSLMYSYFALKAAKIKLPKMVSMFITAVQIAQFVIAAVINVLVFYARITNTQPKCDRHDVASLFISLLGLAYLVLFCNFFAKTYISNGKFKSKLE